ncbi:hypothetical protein [Asanoa iriomotensis]|uniref:Uncharacterized protein n=1 Tax=Asanoa iriomotensis TaxID=234613 RepID=A0ABQ4C6E7_9ACTN|nr:hypothetical protein [Asanoa iriomotensis]GIF58354.1 hypothetical protein Air01nite_44490 [Asanoa iriomotensis]
MDDILGDDPLVDGMTIAVRYRRDFVVTDAARFLATARRHYRDLHPEATEAEAEEQVTAAADAIYVLLEHAGLIGDAADARLAEHGDAGLRLGGWRSQVTFDEPEPLRAGYDCLRTGDVFALPADR